MLAVGLKKKKKPSRRWWRCSPVFRDLWSRIARPRNPRLGNSPFLVSFQKHHLEMMIILTLRQQSVLRGLAFPKPHVSTRTTYCYSVFSFCLFLCDQKLCVIAKNYLDSCLLMRGLAIRIGKFYTLYSISETTSVKV